MCLTGCPVRQGRCLVQIATGGALLEIAARHQRRQLFGDGTADGLAGYAATRTRHLRSCGLDGGRLAQGMVASASHEPTNAGRWWRHRTRRRWHTDQHPRARWDTADMPCQSGVGHSPPESARAWRRSHWPACCGRPSGSESPCDAAAWPAHAAGLRYRAATLCRPVGQTPWRRSGRGTLKSFF